MIDNYPHNVMRATVARLIAEGSPVLVEIPLEPSRVMADLLADEMVYEITHMYSRDTVAMLAVQADDVPSGVRAGLAAWLERTAGVI